MKLPRTLMLNGKECDILIGVSLDKRAFAILCRDGKPVLEFEDDTIRKVKSRMKKWLTDNKLK